MLWNVISYQLSSEVDVGTYYATIRAAATDDERLADELTLKLDVTDTEGVTTKKGDQVVVEYTVWDEDGNELDSGTLPATAGEPEAGPAGQVAYIDGFYLGLLGMQKDPLSLAYGETKKVRVPPELAYGTDPEAHELGGVTLIFELTIVLSQSGWVGL